MRSFPSFSRSLFSLEVICLAGLTWVQTPLAGSSLERLPEAFEIRGTIVENKDVSTVTRGADGMGLLASDEGSVVQVLAFSEDGRGARIVQNRTLVQPPTVEIDFEASTWHEGWYYVTGSHGAAKKRGTYGPDRASIFRFRVSAGDGEITDLQRASLAPVFERHSELAPFHRRPLQERGLNVEGLAARADDPHLYVGLRSPNLEGQALILRVDPEAVFSGARDRGELFRAKVGAGLGIRAMTAVRDGFLLVAGNAGSEAVKRFPRTQDYVEGRNSELFHWNPDSGETRRLGMFPKIKKGKEEGILVLAEGADGSIEMVIVYDSIKDGGFYRFRYTP